MLELRPCSIAEIETAPNMQELLTEYSAESSLPELGQPTPQWDTYRALEASKLFHPVAAFEGPRVLGFIFQIIAPLPHYGVTAATIESYFVLKAERSKNLGIKLLRAAEERARVLGAKAMLLSAPAGAALARLAPGLGYRHSNDVFVRAIA